MVLGQIAGVATAFGTGELAGAGFGPNYTILMKLGYEFYSPRILDEMNKNPERSFENTKYWRQFQIHLKMYSDKVITQTLDKLLSIPDATLDALNRKFTQGQPESVSDPLGIVNTIINPEGLETGTTTQTNTGQRYAIKGVPMFLTFNIIPNPEKILGNALAPYQNNPNQQSQTLPKDSGSSIKTYQTSTGLTVARSTLKKWRFQDLNNAMSAITKGNSPYSHTTQTDIRREWNKSRSDQDKQKVINREQQIKTFQKVTIAPSNIPARTTRRPAGQSVKLERNKLIKDIASASKSLTAHQKAVRNIKFGSGQGEARRTQIININKAIETKLIKRIKTAQQKLTFLLKNYTF